VTIDKQYNDTVTGNYTFRFEYPESYLIDTSFDVVSFGEQTFGYEDQDELTIYPGTIKFTLTDFNWNNFKWFKKSMDDEGLENSSSTDIRYYFPMSVEIFSDTENLGKFFITETEQNLEEYTLDILVTTGYDRLKRINVNNPYLMMKFESLGFFKAERLAKVIPTNANQLGEFTEFNIQILGGHIAKAFGGISPLGYCSSNIGQEMDTIAKQRFGFTVRPYPGAGGSGSSPQYSCINATLMTVDDINPEHVNEEVSNNSDVLHLGIPYNSIDVISGNLKVIDFITTCLKIINPDITPEIVHDLKFGNESTSTEVDIKGIWISRPYDLIFGRTIIMQRNFYDTYVARMENFFDTDLTFANEHALDPTDNDPSHQGRSPLMDTEPVLINKDANWIAWDISGAGMNGAQNKSITESIKDFCKGFFMGVDFKKYDKVILYKRGFRDPGFPNPFGDGADINSTNIMSLRQRHVNNRKRYVEIGWLDNQQRARIGNITNNDEEILSYDVKYSAQKGKYITVRLLGGATVTGTSTIVNASGGIVPSNLIGAGTALATIQTNNQGNVYFKESNGTTIRFVTVVKDSRISFTGSLLDYICKVEYTTKKENRPNYDIEVDGINWEVNKVYDMIPPDIYGVPATKVRPTEVSINRENGTTKITAIEVI